MQPMRRSATEAVNEYPPSNHRRRNPVLHVDGCATREVRMKCVCGNSLTDHQASRYYSTDRICTDCASEIDEQQEAEQRRIQREYTNGASADRARRLLGV
jgi:hypothetical protein